MCCILYNKQQDILMKSKSFGITLRETREDENISLRSLAKESGVDAAYLSRVERELNPAPKVEVIQKIADALCQIMQLDTANCEKLIPDSASDYINRNSNSFNAAPRESSKALYAAKLKPTNKSTFNAGSRAVIEVDGSVSPSQEEQLKLIANLVQSILKDK